MVSPMSAALILVEIVGYVALLLWGTHMVTSGVLRAFGAILRQQVGSSLSRPWKAFLSGVIITLALQSSTATGLMASSFAAHGILAAAPGFVLMLGANVGTALVTQVFTFSTGLLMAPLFLIGFVLFQKSLSTRWRNMGRTLIGLGLMFLSLHALVATFQPLADLPLVQQVLGALGDQALLALLIGIGAAWVCHSSVAVVLLVLSMATSGVLPLSAGLAMVLGANLGGALPPFLEASGPVAKRLPLGNLLVRSIGVVLGMVLLPAILAGLQGLGHLEPRALVDAHLAFNILIALVAMPFAKPASALLVRMLPSPPEPVDPSHPKYLDPSLVSQPHLALANVEREALRLSDILSEQLQHARIALSRQDPGAVSASGKLGDAITGLGRSIRRYVGKIPAESTNDEEQERIHELLIFVLNVEHIADIVPHHLVEPVVERSLGGEILKPRSQERIDKMMETIIEGLGLAVAVLIRRDVRAARGLVETKVRLREEEQEWAIQAPASVGFASLQGGVVEVDVVLKAIRECRRIYGHMGAIAYHLLEGVGKLRSRVAFDGS